VCGGKGAALELLVRLTRINEEGHRARERITREEAVHAAGNEDKPNGERVVQLLSGERKQDGSARDRWQTAHPHTDPRGLWVQLTSDTAPGR
jgi:hypothetical protein